MHRRRQVTICHNARARARLVYRGATIDWRGRTRARRAGGRAGVRAGEAIYHPDEEKSITFQRHLSPPPSPYPPLPHLRPVTCVAACDSILNAIAPYEPRALCMVSVVGVGAAPLA